MNGPNSVTQRRFAEVLALKESTFAGTGEILRHIKTSERWTALYERLHEVPSLKDKCPSPRTLAKIGASLASILEDRLDSAVTRAALGKDAKVLDEQLLGVRVHVSLAEEAQDALSDEFREIDCPVSVAMDTFRVLKTFLEGGGSNPGSEGWRSGCSAVISAFVRDEPLFILPSTGQLILRDGILQAIRNASTADTVENFWTCTGDLASDPPTTIAEKRQMLTKLIEDGYSSLAQLVNHDPRYALATNSEARLHQPDDIYTRALADYTLRTLAVERGIALGLCYLDTTSPEEQPEALVQRLIKKEDELIAERKQLLLQEVPEELAAYRTKEIQESLEKHKYFRLALIKNKNWLIATLS